MIWVYRTGNKTVINGESWLVLRFSEIQSKKNINFYRVHEYSLEEKNMANNFEEKVNVVKKYLPKCNSLYSCYTYGNIPRDKFDNACSSYAGHMEYSQCIGLIDETVFGSGKKGMIFGTTGFYSDSHNGIMLYKDGYKWNSLGSSYKLNAMNEMLSQLCEIDTRPSGWEIAGSLLKGAWNWYQENADLFESNEEPVAQAVNEEDDETQEMMQALNGCVEYVKRLQRCVNDALDGDWEERVEAIGEMNDVFQDGSMMIEGESVPYEGMIDVWIQSCIEDGQIEGIEEVNANETITDFHSKITDLLSEDDAEENDDQLCDILRQYQKWLRKTRKVLKQILENAE